MMPQCRIGMQLCPIALCPIGEGGSPLQALEVPVGVTIERWA